ncbi:ATP-binding protein [Hymenobacter negativus]|uniref:histidine kinase n=1 Tax=Hymenobacter negativus TaxID=2795026 RepID=A0ABS3QK64_9BACT|nr:ATP-binding protein [Hymenobacter negativus]MBO2011080.1 response regulator [Hymenobacter negativus]
MSDSISSPDLNHGPALVSSAYAADKAAQHLALLLELLPEGIALFGADSSVEAINHRFFVLYGLPDSPADWVGRPVNELLARVQTQVLNLEDFLARARALFPLTSASLRGELLELRDGRFLATDIVPAPAEIGHPGQWLLCLRDVTAKHRLTLEMESVMRIPRENPNPVLRLAASGKQLYANEAAARLGDGLSRAERVRVQRHLRALGSQALTCAEANETEIMLGARFFTVRVVPFVADGYVNLYLVDITARVQAKRQLQEQQQFYESILNELPAEVFVVDPQYRYQFVNPAAVPDAALRQWMLGRTNAEYNAYLGRSATVAEHRQRRLQEVLNVRQRVEWMETMDGATPSYTLRRLQPVPEAGNAVHLVIGYGLDVTTQEVARQQLERSEKEYRDLMHYAQALICTYDQQGIVLTMNPALATLLNYPVAELLGQPVATFLPAEDRPAFAEYLMRIGIDGEAEGVLRVQPRGSAGFRFLLYHNFLMREPGRPPYVISHAHDITERIQAEHELKRAKEAAESASRAKENFLANMSHEIRTPLNGVLGMARQLGKTRLDAHQQELLRVINTSGQHLLGVINDVLDMAKITAGKLDFEQVSFNICDSMEEALQPFVLQIQEKGLAFHNLLLREHIPHAWVIGDPYRINQILLNLVSNALKFTKRGSITVAGRQVAETATHLTVEFRVTDTGIGIPPDKQDQIFDGFTQAYADTTRQFGGTGLGLSISRALVQQLGGTLTLESEVGTGSTFGFSLTLPTAEAPNEAGLQVAGFNTGTLVGLRALLVEDNEINREVVRFILEEWGVVLEEAVDGEQGLQMLKDHDYDVVLMDIQMPGLSGVEVTEAVRLLPDPIRAQVPILALTANAFRKDTERYRAAGMNDYLAKPFEEDELYRKLDALRTAPRNTAPYDLTKLRAMAHGRDAFVTKIIRSFLVNTPTSLAQLEDAAAAGYWDRVAEITHHIKPNLEMMGVAAVAGLVSMLEKAPDATQSVAERPALVAQFVTLVQRALSAVPAELPQ